MLSFWCNFLKNKPKQSSLQLDGGDFTAVFTDLTENIGFNINTIVTRPCLGVIGSIFKIRFVLMWQSMQVSFYVEFYQH